VLDSRCHVALQVEIYCTIKNVKKVRVLLTTVWSIFFSLFLLVKIPCTRNLMHTQHTHTCAYTYMCNSHMHSSLMATFYASLGCTLDPEWCLVQNLCMAGLPFLHHCTSLSGLFCAILCATIVHSAMHTHMNRPNSSLEWILSHWAHFYCA